MYNEYGELYPYFTEKLVNDWNIDNDHRDEGETEMDQTKEQQYKVVATWYPDPEGENSSRYGAWAGFAANYAFQKGVIVAKENGQLDIVVPVVPSLLKERPEEISEEGIKDFKEGWRNVTPDSLKAATEMTEEDIKDFTDKVKNTNAL